MPGTKAPEAERREQILAAAYEIAAREGLEGMTIQRVAEFAGLSPGLVIFHFKTKRRLVMELLDQLLLTTTVLQVGPEITDIPSPVERWIALLRQEMRRLSREPLRTRLTFDFWAAGIRDAEVGDRLREEFRRYREAFRPLAATVLETMPDRFVGVTPEGLSGVGVSFIKGCAVQSMIEPDHFDIAEYLVAVEGLMLQATTAPAAVASPLAPQRHADQPHPDQPHPDHATDPS